MAKRHYLVVLVTGSDRYFRSAEHVVRISPMPVKVAAEWKAERRKMTSGLRRKIRENVN